MSIHSTISPNVKKTICYNYILLDLCCYKMGRCCRNEQICRRSKNKKLQIWSEHHQFMWNLSHAHVDRSIKIWEPNSYCKIVHQFFGLNSAISQRNRLKIAVLVWYHDPPHHHLINSITSNNIIRCFPWRFEGIWSINHDVLVEYVIHDFQVLLRDLSPAAMIWVLYWESKWSDHMYIIFIVALDIVLVNLSDQY